MVASFGRHGALRLVAPDPVALCAEIERLLNDAEMRTKLTVAGPTLMSERTWRRAAGQIDDALRALIASAVTHAR
jgi:hypothetical protein